MHALEIYDNIAIVIGLADIRNAQEFDKLILSQQLWEYIGVLVSFSFHRSKQQILFRLQAS